MSDRAKKTTPNTTSAAQRSEEGEQRAQREAASAPAPRAGRGGRGAPRSFSSADVLAMQRTVGNRAVQRLMVAQGRSVLDANRSNLPVIQRVKAEGRSRYGTVDVKEGDINFSENFMSYHVIERFTPNDCVDAIRRRYDSNKKHHQYNR